jgi:hypothetical protein
MHQTSNQNLVSARKLTTIELDSVSLASALASWGATKDYSIQEDPLNLEKAATDFLASLKQMKSLGSIASASSNVTTLLKHIDLSRVIEGEADPEGEDAEEGEEVYTLPNYERDIAPIISEFKKCKGNLAERLAILLDSVLLGKLYNENPVLKGTFRTVNIQQLRVLFECYVEHCNLDADVMIEKYEGYKVNLTNFKLANGCVCHQEANWLKWKLAVKK